jgi:CBS domain-containing protein
MSDAEDAYAETFDNDFREIRGARFDDTLLDDTLEVLAPPEPVCVRESVTVREAVNAMVAHHRAGVLIVDAHGRLVGIFTERDVLLRVVGKELDANRTPVGQVMTRDPEALRMRDRVAYALHSMSVAGYRTVPIVDDAMRPVGVVTASDVIRWLADLFPEVVLNLPPGDTIKNPEQIDAG